MFAGGENGYASFAICGRNFKDKFQSSTIFARIRNIHNKVTLNEDFLKRNYFKIEI